MVWAAQQPDASARAAWGPGQIIPAGYARPRGHIWEVEWGSGNTPVPAAGSERLSGGLREVRRLGVTGQVGSEPGLVLEDDAVILETLVPLGRRSARRRVCNSAPRRGSSRPRGPRLRGWRGGRRRRAGCGRGPLGLLLLLLAQGQDHLCRRKLYAFVRGAGAGVVSTLARPAQLWLVWNPSPTDCRRNWRSGPACRR